MHEKALNIAKQSIEDTYKTTVIYSNNQESNENGDGEWIKVPNEYFYGRKLKKALHLNEGDLCMIIQADADSENWPGLIERTKEVFSLYEKIGVYAPDVDMSAFESASINMGTYKDSLIHAAFTDGICFCISKAIAHRLLDSDLDNNNIGWGTNALMCSFARTKKIHVLRDLSIQIKHPRGSGYSHIKAMTQMNAYINTFTEEEKKAYNELNTFYLMKKNQ